MNNEYPRMLFKAPGPEEFHGGHFDTKIVNSDDERDEALDAGWHLTTPEATADYEAEKQEQRAHLDKAPEASPAPETAPEPAPAAEVKVDHDAERAALKAEAAALELVFPKNVTNEKLRELIEAKKSPAQAAEGEE